MKKHEDGSEPLEEEVEENPREDEMCWKSSNMKVKKKKKSSGKHRAKKKKKRRPPHKKNTPSASHSDRSSDLPRQPSAMYPMYVIKEELAASSTHKVKLTESELVDQETAGPEISEQEIEMFKFPHWQEALHALLVTKDFTSFVTDRPVDMRLVRSSFPDLDYGDDDKKLSKDDVCEEDLLKSLEGYIKSYSPAEVESLCQKGYERFDGTLADFIDQLSSSSSSDSDSSSDDSEDFVSEKKLVVGSSDEDSSDDELYQKTIDLYEDKSLSLEE